MIIQRPYGLLVLILFMFSCSASQFGWKAESESGDRAGDKGRYLEDFDPLSLDDDDIVIRSVKNADSTNDEDESILIGTQPESEESAQEMVQGYRVQLLATGDEFQAREAKKNAIFRFEEGVYLIFEAPLYKLRIGDCQTRREAEQLRENAVRNGFGDAWIVPSRIFLKKDAQRVQ